MFKKKFPSLSSLGSDGNTAFLRAARAGHLDKVLEHLKANIDINTSNSNGLNALHLASKDGHVHVVTELLKRGAVVDAATKKGNTALHIASLAGQEEVVKLLVATGAAVNVQSQNGFTPLYMAAQENHDNVVRFLLANEANQSLATEDGFTPLAVAMQQGHDKVVAVLLENDTRGKVRLPALHIAAKKDDCKAAALLLQNNHNPDVTSKSGFTPLHIAAHYGNESIANLLLNRGADVNYAAKHNITPLHVAAKWGKTNMVSLLLEKGANIESKTRDGLTPLHCAARSGHEQVVDMMLERGAPISSKTKNGLAPLHMASQGDHVDAARILLYHRASVDEVTVDYLTALHVAAHCGHVRVAKLLLDRKADPNARALNGFTPLHIACKKNRIKVVELLLKHGASIEATTESGLTPLHVASFMGCMNIVIYLLQHEANPDVPTVRGETPLHLAARANQTDIIRILLRNGAQVDARAREQQTPLHIASRLGNVDIVMLLLQHGAAVDSTTKDLYTALHIAGKEGQEEVAAVLLEHGASLTATTKKGFTPLHLAAKYGNMKVAKLVLQRDAPVDAQGKNGVTPLHVASHYDHQNVALLLLDKGASPHATAKNGHTPLHIAARKNQMDIATTLLEYGAKANAESKAGFTPLHLSSQEGHTDMSTLLIEHQADTNHKAKNGLTPLHLCAQEDRVNVAAILVKNGAQVESITKAGYTPLHVASHFGQGNMVRFLLQQGGDVKASTNIGYTPLHQASQQGHTTIVNLLLENAAQPNSVTSQGQTALSIAQKLGYISVVESLKVVTDPSVSGNATLGADEKYRVVAPESMQETFMSDSEDEGGEDTMLSDQPYRYLTVDEMKSLGDDSLPIDVTRDERMDSNRECMAPPTAVDDTISPQHTKETYQQFAVNYTPDNVDIGRHPLNVGKLHWKNFLVSFLVDARGGAMRGCRHSGVRVIVPPRKATMPMRVTCRYLKRDKLSHPPPLMEGEALASRILELGPVGAKFLGPVIIEVPHFGSLRGMEREIVILRSDNGETWREHTLEASDDAVHQVLNDSFEGEELSALEEVNAGRTTRILTTDFPQYFAVVSRIRQEVHAIGPEGGMVSSSVVPQVQAVFPQGALTKKIKVGLQAQPVPAELTAKLLGNRVAVSPIVTVEPRRRKFHKPITLTIPVPQAANKGMINQYSGDAPTLRLLCSITGGTTRAQWEDVTGSTPLTFVNDCVSFTTTVSARFWLMDCRNIGEATKMATELYKEAIHVPFMAKFVVFSKRVDILEARLRVFCMTDDKEDKTLEHQEHFLEVAKSRDVEVLEGKSQYVEFAGNLVPVTKSGDQLQLGFRAFRENRLPFTVRVKDPHADTVGRILFMKEAKVAKGEPPQQPICILNIVLPETILPESGVAEPDIVALHNKYTFLRDGGLMFTPGRGDVYQRTDLRLSDISNLLSDDWVLLATELKVSTSDVNSIKTEYPSSGAQQAMAMLRLWLQQSGNKATGNALETALRKVGREDIIQQCIFNVDEIDRTHLDQSGFDSLKEELGPSRDTSLRRDVSLDITYDEQDIMKESESVEELVEAEKKEPYQDKNITNISGTKDDVEKQTTDVEETKYIGEEKVVEEERKSVAELKEIFAQDKRDRQYERQPRPFSDKETPPQSADDVTQRATTTIDDDTTTTQEVRRIMSIPISDIPDRLKDDDTSRIIPSPSDTLAPHTASEADQRRDSELFQGVSEELVRLETTYKVTPAEEESEVLSPKVSKTPPPSPAEFKDTTGVTTWQTSDSLTTAEQPLSSQEWTETSQDLKTEEVKPESCRLTHDADQRESPAEGSLTKPFLPKPSPRLKPEPRDDFVTPQTSPLETFGSEAPIAVSPLSHIGTVSHGVNVGMSPSETITEHEISKEDIESKPENEIDGDVQSYSDRKKFWEQMTGKSKITSTTSFEQSESVFTTKQRTISLDSTTPPVPRPRSTINTSPALTISALSEAPAKSETERDSETISFRTSLMNVQHPPVSLGKISDTTGSSDLSGHEGSETEAKYIPSIPAGVPTTAPSAVAAITQGEIQSSPTESSDSEAEYIADFEGETLTYVNTGFVPDEEELETPVKIDNKLKEKKDQIERDANKQKESKTETLFKEMKKVSPLGVETSSILEKSFHHAVPIAITKKTLYERSVSLPTEDLIPFDHNGSVRAKKRYFEAQIKKEMVVDQLMTQLEEEASPEHKSIHQTTKEVCTIVDQGSNITHPGHIDMFSHKPDKHNKPPLSEETEIATSKEKEVIETKIITVKDIAKGFEETKTWELKETISKSKECKSKDVPKAVENEPFSESKTEEVKQEHADTSKGRVNVSFDIEPTVKEVPKILKVKDLARGFEKESSFDGLEKDTKKDYVSESVKTIDSKKPKEIVSGVAEEINMIYKTVICEKLEESDERKAVKDIRSVFESKIQGPTFDLISKIPVADTKKTSLAKTLSAEQPLELKELSSNVQQVLLEEEIKHDFEQGKSMGSQGEAKEVINLVSGLEESSSQKTIEVTQYKTDIFTKLSDSLEDHVDKSEIEGSEKEKYIDEDMTNIEKEIEEQGIKEVTLSEEPIPFITVTLSGIQRIESYIKGESEDTASESDVTPEDSREKAHPLYQPEEHIPDTVWEVPVQEQVETIMDEVVHDIPIEKQVIIEKDEDEYQEKSDEEKPVEEQDEGQDTLVEWPITEEEARVIAEEVIESIEAEVTKRAKLTSEFQLTSSSTRPIAEIAGAQVAELLKKLSGKEVLGPHEVQIMESILVRKQREQIKKISRTDTTTSSMEITDEDLRSSGVETDLSPLESHTGKLDIVEDTTLSEDMATELGFEDHETMKDGKSYIDIALEGEEVVEKTLAEVRESLGAAQEELIEEHKKKEEVIQKKESPSEFEFKVLTFENKLDEKIEESHFEDMSATADYIECDEDGKLITHATDILSKDQHNKIEETTLLEKEEMGATYDGIAIEKTDTKAKEKEKHDFKFTETKLNDVRSEKNIQEGLVSETHTTASFSDEEDSLLKSKVIKTKTITKHGTGTSKLTEDLLKEGTTSEYKICVETKIEGKVDSSVICKKDIKQAEEAKSKLKEKETTIEETDTGTMKTVVTEEKQSQSQVIKETKLNNITSFSKYEKDDEVNLFIPESKEGILDAKAQQATITSVVESLNNDKFHIDIYQSTLSSKREEKTEAITKTEHKVETTKTFEVDVESLDALLAQKGLPALAEDFETKEIVKDAVQVACKEEIKRTSSEESQRSLSQDESAKSPVEAISSSSSTTTSGKRGDSEMVRVIERPDGSETTVVVLRHSRVPKDGESSSSGERSISAGANLRADRRSGADFEAWSSSGESHYHSFEQTSDSGRTYSRPCSSDAEALMAGAGTTGSSEYESALTSQEISRSGITSQDYHTAVSSLSSRESMRSLDSESSGHLASIEVSSETSETLVPSALELEKDMEGVLGILTMDDDNIGEHRETASRPPTVDTILEDKSVLEPYDTHIPVHIIRGESPPKIPHHRAYSITPSVISDLASTSERDYVTTDFSHVGDGRLSPFEMISESDILDYPVDEIASEDEIDIPEPRDIERTTSTDESADDERPHCMKRSHEMIFQPEPRAIISGSPLSGSPVELQDEKFGSSVEEGSILSMSYSSTSEVAALRTVIELSRTDSEHQDGSGASEQLSMTVSGTSEQLSLEDIDIAGALPVSQAQLVDFGTCTYPPSTSSRELHLSSVTITTSSVDEYGVQSVCTQVTSQSHTPVPDEDEDETVNIDEDVTQNGPTQVDYVPEYDDYEETHKRPMGHRRKESTSSFIPAKLKSLASDLSQDTKIITKTSIKKEIEGVEDAAESDKYTETMALTLKEVRSDEKKDIDEAERIEEESYQTEADQGFHRDLREGRVLLDDAPETEEDTEAEIRDLDASRPQSQVSKSDSEGHRPISSGFSDDRPDSELTELLKQCSSDGGKDFEDPIERPLSPEPGDECEIKDDMPEFSSEAQASVKELEIEYSGAFSRSIGYASHVSPIREERIGKRYDEAGNVEISQLACEKPLSEHEDDMAEAEAAFQMAPYAYSVVPSTLPATILEDTVAEKHELETRERTLKEKQKIQEAISPGGFIPDITVTQHMTPLLDKGFHYPDLELEEVARSASQTPASMSSRGSSETETDQGREYILEEEEETDDYIAEENEQEAVLDEKGTETSHSVEEMSATEEKTVYETLTKESPKPILEQSSPSESPTSDSFEMLETPEITDDYVVIEEVGKEAEEHDTEGKSLHISKKKREPKKHDPQDDEVLIPSPPAPTTRMTDLKYYPEHGAVEEDMAPFPFEDSPPTAAGTKKSVGVRTQGFESGKDESDYEREVEAGKKWIEMQFQGDPSAAAAATGYGYEMEFERAPLEDIKEEEVNDFDQSSKVGSIGSYRESIGSFGSVKDSYSSTPEYDVLAGRRYFTRSGDHDDVSMSSLQEFEQLEHQIALEGTRKRIHGSQDSLNGSLKRTSSSSRSGQGDDISLSSLKEFEGLETACIEATKIETRAKEEEALLSEIEEGHESQVSESESCETMSAGGERGGESVDSDDYEKRMFEIDEIIRQAQTNVERFIDTKEKICLAESTESSVLDKTESVGRGDSMEEVARIPELDLDQPFYSQHGIISKTTQSIISKKSKQSWRDANDDVMQTSTDSLDLKTTKTSTPQDPLGNTNSLDIKTVTGKAVDMTASADSIDFHTQLTPSGHDDIMTDSIELAADSFIMANSTDSLEIAATAYGNVETGMTDSIEEESILGQGEGDFHESGSGGHDQSSSSGREGDLSSSGKDDSGEHGRVHPPRSELMLGSTDSLDPTSSTATHATYQYETDSVMSSSFTSGGSNTMVSSTDTLDPTGGAGGIDGIDLEAAARSGVWFEDVNGGGRHFVSEVIEPSEEDEFSHTIRRTVELPPEVRKVSFKGPDAERALREYVERFAPGKDVTESEVVDSEGNVHIKRVVQRRVVIRSEDLGETELTGPDLDEYLRHVAQQNGPGDDKQYSEERTGVPDSDYTHLMTSISGGDPTSFSSPSHSTEVVTHHTYVSRHITHPSSSGDVVTTTTQQETVAPYSTGDLVASHQEKEKDLQVTSVEKTPVRASAARRRPPPIHDISIDVDEDREVDVREHDWRFQFKHHSEEEEDGADTQPEVASARLQTTQTRVVGDDGFITTVTTVTQQRESPDNSDLQELLDKLAQEKH